MKEILKDKRDDVMNKKLFLIPITLVSCFMSACTMETKHIPIEDILKYSDESVGNFYIEDPDKDYGSYQDYKHSIASILKDNLNEAEFVARTACLSGYNNIKTVQYRFNTSNKHEKMDFFMISVYENGVIDTYACGSGYPFAPKDQYTTYKIEKEKAKTIFNTAVEEVEKRETLKAEEKAQAEEYTTMDNFFSEYSKQQPKRINYHYQGSSKGYKHLEKYSYVIYDKDGDIYEDILGLECQIVNPEKGYLEVSGYENIVLTAVEQPGERWSILIDRNNGNGYMYYFHDSDYYGGFSIEKYFTVNKEKLNALDDKLYEIVLKENKNAEPRLYA